MRIISSTLKNFSWPAKFIRKKWIHNEMHSVGVKIQIIGSILQPLHL
jgi:hypothetical protein